jgi:glycine hydroxymethyltransferase
VDTRGRVVGIVTSCSIDTEGYQLGQAYLKKDLSKAGTQLAILAGSNKAKANTQNGYKLGDKITLPESITILTRFPKK